MPKRAATPKPKAADKKAKAKPKSKAESTPPLRPVDPGEYHDIHRWARRVPVACSTLPSALPPVAPTAEIPTSQNTQDTLAETVPANEVQLCPSAANANSSGDLLQRRDHHTTRALDETVSASRAGDGHQAQPAERQPSEVCPPPADRLPAELLPGDGCLFAALRQPDAHPGGDVADLERLEGPGHSALAARDAHQRDQPAEREPGEVCPPPADRLPAEHRPGDGRLFAALQQPDAHPGGDGAALQRPDEPGDSALAARDARQQDQPAEREPGEVCPPPADRLPAEHRPDDGRLFAALPQPDVQRVAAHDGRQLDQPLLAALTHPGGDLQRLEGQPAEREPGHGPVCRQDRPSEREPGEVCLPPAECLPTERRPGDGCLLAANLQQHDAAPQHPARQQEQPAERQPGDGHAPSALAGKFGPKSLFCRSLGE